jgi:PAS domain S-box-containing protein
MQVVLLVAGGVSAALLAVVLWLSRSGERERRLQHEANQALAARIYLLEEQVGQAIVTINMDGLIRGLNPAAEQLFGYAEWELLGHNISRLMPAPASVFASAGHGSVARKKATPLRVSFRTARATEREIYVFFDPAPAEGFVDKGLVEKNGVEKSIQSRVSNPALPRQAGTLEVAERVVSRIVRQLEGLLTTINGYTELALHATGEDSPVRKDLEEIATASDNASHLARHLLAFTGNQLVPLECVDLNAMLERLQPQFGMVQIEFCAEHLYVLANHQSLRHIILIFCGSARHRVGQETAMQIVTSRRQVVSVDYAAISISDCGPVLAPSTLACLFEPLFLDREGLGVELSAIYGMVRNLGGLINVTSEQDRGTTFEILIPLARGDAESAERGLQKSATV